MRIALALAIALAPATPRAAPHGKIDPQGISAEKLGLKDPVVVSGPSSPRVRPASAPDVVGPGAVLTAGQVHMKVTNWGYVGNVFPDLSSDPAGQWPGNSGVEYLSSIRLAVAAVNPTISPADPANRWRVSESFEWRPATLDPVDHIYSAYEGIANGLRYLNDDGDQDFTEPVSYLQPRVDEDFLDGHDNDGDGLVDEDYAAIGDQMFSLVMRDDTPEAIHGSIDERHIPLGLECRQTAWCYRTPGFSDFNVVDYTIFNRSGHMLDSLTIGWQVDMDCGPVSNPYYFDDDRDLPDYPHGDFAISLGPLDPRYQSPHDPAIIDVSADSGLCARLPLRVNGFSVADEDGDGGATPGIAGFLLVDQTTDPLGVSGPKRTGFRAFRSYRVGTPWAQGGAPTNDSLRFALMTGQENVDETGFVVAPPGDWPGDYVQWCSVGPYRNVLPGESVHATIAFAVQRGRYAAAVGYASDYQSFRNGTLGIGEFLARYPLLRTALDLQAAFEGIWEPRRDGIPSTDWHGRETWIRGAHGSPPVFVQDCRDNELFDGRLRPVVADQLTWFDFDCDWCTGVWNYPLGGSLPDDQRWLAGDLHHTWVVPASSLVGIGNEVPMMERPIAAYPNPARNGARIAFELPAPAIVRLGIYDMSGRMVRLTARQRLEAGRHDLAWDGRDGGGVPVPAGVYAFKLVVGAESHSGQIVILR